MSDSVKSIRLKPWKVLLSAVSVVALSSCLSEIRSAEDSVTVSNSESADAVLNVVSGTSIPQLAPSAKHVVRLKLENNTLKDMQFVSATLGGSNPGAFTRVAGAPCNGPNVIPSGTSCVFVVTATGGTGCTNCQAELAIEYQNAKGDSKTSTASFSFDSSTPSQAINTTDFAVPTNKIETVIGNDVPRLEAIDLSGATSPGGRMLISDEYLLPKGLIFDPTTDSVTGFPTQAGVYPVEFCSVQQGMKTNVCKTVTYRILAPKTLTAVRETETADATCTSSLGTGSSESPILIATANDLNTCVRNYPRGAFKLTADIDLSSFTNSTFNPLPAFYGQFDGNGKEIRNYTWSYVTAGSNYVGHIGFFRSLQLHSIVKNLTLRSISITGANSIIGTASVPGSATVGVLAGYSRGAIVYQVQVHTAMVTNCRRNCGGFIGSITHPSYSNIENDPTSSADFIDGYYDRLTGTNLSITNPFDGWGFSGGVSGGMYATPFRISRAKVQSTISTGNGGGGILGFHYSESSASSNSNLWLDQCQSSGTISMGAAGGGAMFGGLIGSMDAGSSITNSFSTMTLSSSNTGMGGLVGNVLDSASGLTKFAIVNSYFKGSVSGSSAMGMLVGGTVAYGVRTYGGSNRLYLVQTRSISSATPILGSAITTGGNTNQDLSGANFQLSTNFSSWSSPPWIISNGSEPSLADP